MFRWKLLRNFLSNTFQVNLHEHIEYTRLFHISMYTQLRKIQICKFNAKIRKRTEERNCEKNTFAQALRMELKFTCEYSQNSKNNWNGSWNGIAKQAKKNSRIFFTPSEIVSSHRSVNGFGLIDLRWYQSKRGVLCSCLLILSHAFMAFFLEII